MAYDSSNNACVIFGGSNTTVAYESDTWAYVFDDYEMAGDFVSAPIDTGGRACFGAIEWSAALPNHTTVKFQLRSAGVESELQSKPFLGPDGTAASCYTWSGKKIFPGHNGSRWIQYRAVLETLDPLRTPVLKSVRIHYNLIHELSIKFPLGGERLGGVQRIEWEVRDPDADNLTFDIYYHRGIVSGPLALNLPNETRSWLWNTSELPSGTYRIRVVARDVDSPAPITVEAISGNFTIYNPPPPPPNTPPTVELLSPPDGSRLKSTYVTLEWAGRDEEGDSLRYRVHLSNETFSPESLPAPRATTTLMSYGPLNLDAGATYYWTVVAFDGRENSTVPGIWRFTILSTQQYNSPPEVRLLSPENGSVLNTTHALLAWNATDPDGDGLTHSIFICSTRFDAHGLPAPLATTLDTSYEVSGLQNGTMYWWTVTADDGSARSAVPEIRSFTIDVSLGNQVPRITSEPPLFINAGSLYEYLPAAVDEDGDMLSFSLVAGPEGMSIDWRTGKISWTPKPRHAGENIVILRVTDTRGGYAEQSFKITVLVTLPRCEITYPKDNDTVRGVITLRGTAVRGLAMVWKVELRVDNGPWMEARGTENWSLELDTGKYRDGKHTIEARALEPELVSESCIISLIIDNSVEGGRAQEISPWLVVSVALPVAIIVVFIVYLSRGRRRSGQ